jgi:hypothetical protein
MKGPEAAISKQPNQGQPSGHYDDTFEVHDACLVGDVRLWLEQLAIFSGHWPTIRVVRVVSNNQDPFQY